MADPRDAARRWLAETIRAVPGSDEMAPSMPDVLAEAIVSGPNTEFQSGAVHGAGCEHWNLLVDDAWAAEHAGWALAHRMVIRLPEQEGAGT